jgi:hypothetical protein
MAPSEGRGMEQSEAGKRKEKTTGKAQRKMHFIQSMPQHHHHLPIPPHPNPLIHFFKQQGLFSFTVVRIKLSL